MLKHVDFDITFQEVPNEISLVLPISNCPYRCKGCHSSELQKDIGTSLAQDLPRLLDQYGDMITCVCFMGEGDFDNDHQELACCMKLVRDRGLKVALYSGTEFCDANKHVSLVHLLMLIDRCVKWGMWPDYLKINPYRSECGGLSSSTTNQVMLRFNRETEEYDDITCLFWKKNTNLQEIVYEV